MILQYVYKPILNFIHKKYTYRLQEKSKEKIMVLCFFLMFLSQFLSMYIIADLLTNDIRDYVICILMGVCIVLSVKGELSIIKWNKFIYIPFVLTGLLILIAGFDHRVGLSFVNYPVFMLIGCICLYYVWGNRGDYGTLFQIMAKGYLLFAVVLMLLCVVQYVHDGSGYTTLGINSNGFAKLILPASICGMYLLVVSCERSRKVLYACLMGAASFIALATNSRFAMLIVLLSLLIGLFVYYKKHRHIKKAFLIIMVSFLAALGVFVYVIPSIYAQTGVQIQIERTDTSDAARYKQPKVSMEDSQKVYLTIWEHLLEDSPFMQKLEDALSGRISIWAAYFMNMSWQGESVQPYYMEAHNQYIELSYRAGILTGIVWLLCNLIAGAMIISGFIRRTDETEFFRLMTYVMFFTISMLDTGTIVMERGFLLLYYVAISPAFIKQRGA